MKKASKKIKVMIVDDDYYVREALELLLRKNPITAVTDVAATPNKALEKMNKNKNNLPVLILLDVKFENINAQGIDYIEKIKKAYPDIKILMSSMSTDEDLIIKAITKGADAYVWKNESTEGIVSAIEKVMEGRFVITKMIAEKLIGKTIELNDYTVEIMPEEKKYQKLTDSLRKTMYLYCFCGMSAKEIAEELCISIHTVNSRIKNAYQILETNNKSDAFNKLVKRFKE